MDKELLRIAIIATGLIIIVGMVISSYLKDKQEHEDELDFYDDEFEDDDEFDDKNEFEDESAEPVKKPSVVQTLKNTYAQKMQTHQPEMRPPAEEKIIVPELRPNEEIDEEPLARPSIAPSIIQFSVITKGHDDFNGADIFDALEDLGLEYGSMKIFERVAENRFVHFGVACITEPGTFPSENIESFYCPGVVFFMQIEGLEDCVDVFDDYVHTIVLFAQRLNGVVLDHRRQVLTQEMVVNIRDSLEYQSSLRT